MIKLSRRVPFNQTPTTESLKGKWFCLGAKPCVFTFRIQCYFHFCFQRFRLGYVGDKRLVLSGRPRFGTFIATCWNKAWSRRFGDSWGDRCHEVNFIVKNLVREIEISHSRNLYLEPVSVLGILRHVADRFFQFILFLNPVHQKARLCLARTKSWTTANGYSANLNFISMRLRVIACQRTRT